MGTIFLFRHGRLKALRRLCLCTFVFTGVLWSGYVCAEESERDAVFPHIKIYSPNMRIPKFKELPEPEKSQRIADWKAWIRGHVDMTAQLPAISLTGRDLVRFGSSEPSLRYDTMMKAIQFFYNLQADPEDMFLHYAEDIWIPDNEIFEGRFLKVWSHKNGSVWTDWTLKAYEDPADRDDAFQNRLNFGNQPGDAVYIGNPWKFNEINLQLEQGQAIGGGWRFEYWNGTQWGPLRLRPDSISDLTASGAILFELPGDWTHANVKEMPLFWVRLRCANAGSQEPIVRSEVRDVDPGAEVMLRSFPGIYGLRYVRDPYKVDGTGKPFPIIVPGWNPDNDPNQDGYVDDTEFANRPAPRASARFKYLSRTISRYLRNRWIPNPANPAFRAFFGALAREIIQPEFVEGVFIDNTLTWAGDVRQFLGNKSYLEYKDEYAGMGLSGPPRSSGDDPVYIRHTNEYLEVIKAVLGTKWLVINSGTRVPFATMEIADAALWEDFIWMQSTGLKDNSNVALLQDKAERIACCPNDGAKGKAVIIDSEIGDCPKEFVDPERCKLFALAGYYQFLVRKAGCEETYYSFGNDAAGVDVREEWFDAVGFDVGVPVGKSQWVAPYFVRDFTKAKVLWRPNAYAGETGQANHFDDRTKMTVYLDRAYRILRADGTMGEEVREVAIRNAEGIILAASHSYGDLSGDGQVTAQDAWLVARYSVGLIPDTQIPGLCNGLTAEEFRRRGDVDGTPGLSANDAMLIAKRAVGLIEKFPVEG